MERIEAIQSEVKALRTQYNADKEASKSLKQSIAIGKSLQTDLYDKKVADRKKVEDLKKQLEVLKAKPAMTPQMALVEDLKDELSMKVSEFRNELLEMKNRQDEAMKREMQKAAEAEKKAEAKK